MKTKDIVVIVLKTLSIYILLQFLAILPTAISFFLMQKGQIVGSQPFSTTADKILGSTGISIMGISIAYLGMATVLFFGARRLVYLFVDNPEEGFSIQSDKTDRTLRFAFQCLGVYALVTWLPNLVYIVIRCLIYGTWLKDQPSVLARFYQNWSAVITPLIGTVIGLFLLFTAKGLIRLIQQTRPMSRDNHTDEKNNSESSNHTSEGIRQPADGRSKPAM